MALQAEAVASACSAVEAAERGNKATLAKAKQTEGEVRACIRGYKLEGERELDILLVADLGVGG